MRTCTWTWKASCKRLRLFLKIRWNSFSGFDLSFSFHIIMMRSDCNNSRMFQLMFGAFIRFTLSPSQVPPCFESNWGTIIKGFDFCLELNDTRLRWGFESSLFSCRTWFKTLQFFTKFRHFVWKVRLCWSYQVLPLCIIALLSLKNWINLFEEGPQSCPIDRRVFW